jgi:hypothetical protein
MASSVLTPPSKTSFEPPAAKAPEPLRAVHTTNFPSLLRQLGASLLVTTYQAGRLVLVLTDPATTTILGPGAKRPTIRGGGKGRVFDIEGGSLALEGLTIAGGRAVRGGGILNHGGTLALDHAVLRGNRADVGGALFNDGKATLTHVVIRGNTTRVGSGLFNARNTTLTRGRSAVGGRR